MKKFNTAPLIASLSLAAVIATPICEAADRTRDTTVIETTDLCFARGYRGTTPVKVVIANGRVQSIEALPNQETPRFFQRVVDNLLIRYKGVKIKKALEMTSEPIPDACTGATYSTRAVQQNIKCALEEYRNK